MADLDGGFFLIEKDVPGHNQEHNGTLQRIGPFDVCIAVYVEPPADVITQGQDAIAAWLSYIAGCAFSDARKLNGELRFHVQIGPGDPI